MIIFPAIDLLGGKCVRLYKGDYNTAGEVAKSPFTTVEKFIYDGATHLHTVDLDGAKNGESAKINRKVIYEICKNYNIFVELGGGLRTMDDLSEAEACGVDRFILGSAATDLNFLSSAVDKYGDKIAVGIDAKSGYVATSGWLEHTGLNYIDFAKQVEKIGVKTIIFTDIDKDGTLEGANYKMLSDLSDAVSCNITASGGIKNMDDIVRLKQMNLYGAICGKSIYSGSLNLGEAINYTKD